MKMSPRKKAGDGVEELLAPVQQGMVGIQQQVYKERKRQSLQITVGETAQGEIPEEGRQTSNISVKF